jgi:broad specificity phosphatase PhoE
MSGTSRPPTPPHALSSTLKTIGTAELAPSMTAPRRSARLATTGSVWVVRHGQRIDQAEGEWWRTAQRPHDPYLTPLGERQAAAAGGAIVKVTTAVGRDDERVEVIYSSPFLRCVQTAAQCAKALGISKIRIEPGLGELLMADWFDYSPVQEARMPLDGGMSTKALAERFGSLIDTSYVPLYDAGERSSKQPRAGRIAFPEDWHEGIARYQATLAALSEASPFSLLVTHGAGVQACAEAIKGCPDMSEMDVDYCCLTNLKRQGAYEWKVATLADAEHTVGLS